MRLLVIGASGLVGKNCFDYFSEQENVEVMGTHRQFKTTFTRRFDAVNITQEEMDLMEELKPEVLIHCGGWTHADECEGDTWKSYLENVQSTQNLLDFATKYQAKFVYISTDYVFDGHHGPYTEMDAPNPINIYGKHKLLSEGLVLSRDDRHLVVRITNVYGDEIRGKNFISRLLNNPENPTSLLVPIDQFATPINAKDVARGIFQLVKHHKSGVYHLSSTDYYSRFQLASKVVEMIGARNWRLEPVPTSATAQRANRPLIGGLLASKFLTAFPTFRFTNVDDYLSTKQSTGKQN